MYYLLYEKDGLLRKHPLDKPEIRIGRGSENDIVIKEPAISKRHCRVRLTGEALEIVDFDSRNGTYVGDSQVREARIGINNSFGLGQTEFYFKRGDMREFRISTALSNIYGALARDRRPECPQEPDTELKNDRQQLALRSLAEKALLDDSPSRFFKHARTVLEAALGSGALLFVEPGRIHFLVDHLSLEGVEWNRIDWSALPVESQLPVPGGTVFAWNYRSPIHASGHYLVYLHPRPRKSEIPAPDFFFQLLEIIGVNRNLVMRPSIIEEAVYDLYRDTQIAIIGESPVLRRVVDLARRIAPRKSFVLILGESGTGKELFARMIHNLSGRGAYVAINCAAIPIPLLESELFGYERGAFTDARQRKIGKIEEASGGTLVLDEIGDMPLEIQSKLLRVIQEKSFVRLGGGTLIGVDLRIIAMTNQDLVSLVRAGKFREDLYYRLRVHQLVIPPLRERSPDLPHLIRHFVRQFIRNNPVKPGGFSETAADVLLNYSWPGNVRELENEILRIMETIDDGELIGRHHLLPLIIDDSVKAVDPLREKIRIAEKSGIEACLRKNNGNKMKTAREMKMSYRGFLKKVKRLGIS